MSSFAVFAKDNSVKSKVLAILVIFSWVEPSMTEAGSVDLSTAKLAIDDHGIVTGLVFRLMKLEPKERITRLRLFSLAVPAGARTAA
jgi:hypothetical protein